MMSINKVLCVFEGIPLWCSEVYGSGQDSALIGGFLSALNSFALQIENQPVNHIAMGSIFWTLVKVHNFDGLFIAVHADTFREDMDDEKSKKRLFEQFITEIITEFTKRFPRAYFKKPPASAPIFNEIKELTKTKMIQYNSLLNRYQASQFQVSIPELTIQKV